MIFNGYMYTCIYHSAIKQRLVAHNSRQTTDINLQIRLSTPLGIGLRVRCAYFFFIAKLEFIPMKTGARGRKCVHFIFETFFFSLPCLTSAPHKESDFRSFDQYTRHFWIGYTVFLLSSSLLLAFHGFTLYHFYISLISLLHTYKCQWKTETEEERKFRNETREKRNRE